MAVTAFAKPNMKLGQWSDSRRRPGDNGERLEWNGRYGIETGPAGGHMIYLPIDGADSAWCGLDLALADAVVAGNQDNGMFICPDNLSTAMPRNDQVLVTAKDGTIAPGESMWWGQAVLFVNDNPKDRQAEDFRDYRSGADIVAQWDEFVGDRDAEAVYADALAEFEAWRVSPESLGLETLTDDEKLLWRQSETILRLGQVMEPVQANRRNRGMFLAALPEGEWHMGWVRDGAYAIVSQAMNGHHREARLGVDAFLNAWAGFFSSQEYLGRDYRISSVRYYGNGKEG